MATKEVRWRALLVPLALGLIVACGGGGSGSGAIPGIVGGGGSGGGGGGGGSGGGGGTGGSGGGTGGSGGGGTTSGSVSTSNVVVSEADAVRFLSYATFGGTKSQISGLVGQDAADWLNVEFQRPPTFALPALQATADADGRFIGNTVTYQFWDRMIAGDDQLRQRMAFALSQIFVYSDSDDRTQDQRAAYEDILIRNAFGNYRELLEEITYSYAMGRYLTYYRNIKGDPTTGRMPDQNYAREIMQLFSIGVVELNMDGTPKAGSPETYTADDIVGLSRVFTGLAGKGTSFRRVHQAEDAEIQPMQMYEEEHSKLEKSFLGTTIPPNTPGEESIQIALDTIFEHPNVAPFLSRQLIQRFTQSDPDPAYVERVAMAFEAGQYTSTNGQSFGTGERGDLTATLAAVLLDQTVFNPPEDNGVEVTSGKIREPVLRFAHMARALGFSNINSYNEGSLRDTSAPSEGFNQHPMRSPSVFNFYRPGYIAPNTRSGQLGLTAPEMQIVSASSTVGYMSLMTDFAFNTGSRMDRTDDTFRPDYSEEIALSDNPAALVDHLAVLMTADRMPEQERQELVSILEQMPISNNSDDAAEDRFQIAATAVSLVAYSPSFAVIW